MLAYTSCHLLYTWHAYALGVNNKALDMLSVFIVAGWGGLGFAQSTSNARASVILLD